MKGLILILACTPNVFGVAAAVPPPPHIPRQTPTQIMMMERVQDEAKTLSAAATPELVSFLASAPFRAALAACCPVAAAMSAPDLLQAPRDEHGGAEMVHNIEVNPSQTIQDTVLGAETNASAFYNIWEYAVLSGSFNVLPATAMSEVNMFGFRAFTGGNATDPGSQPKSFSEAQERPIYTALNSRAVDSGNPTFGPISVVFRLGYVRNMTFIAPMDTGFWELFCNDTNPNGTALRSLQNNSQSPVSIGAMNGLGVGSRFGRERRHPRSIPGLGLGLGDRPQSPVNCTAWAGRTFGTLGHLDHLLLLSERLWLNVSTTLETLNRLFEPISQSATLHGDSSMHYLEADLAGNVLFPDGGVRSVLAQARLLGTPTAAVLRDWCVGNGWALLWAAGPYCLVPENNALCYSNHTRTANLAVRQERVLDPFVVERLGPGRTNVQLPPGTEAAFRAVETSAFGPALNATDRDWTVMTPRVQAGWEALLEAVPAEARMRALRVADGCDLDRCVGAEAAEPAGGKTPRCACYVG